MSQRSADKMRDSERADRPAAKTPWSDEAPRVLVPGFYQPPELETRWRSYLAAGAVLIAPCAQFERVGERIIHFLGPVRASIVAGESLSGVWPPAGPWSRSPLKEV